MALHHAGSGEVINIQAGGSGPDGALKSALVKTRSFEAVRLELARGTDIAPHSVPGEFTLQCLQGSILLKTPDEDIRVAAGEWVYLLGGVVHSVHAEEDSVLLVTIILLTADRLEHQ